jgi:hypothetical protein
MGVRDVARQLLRKENTGASPIIRRGQFNTYELSTQPVDYARQLFLVTHSILFGILSRSRSDEIYRENAKSSPKNLTHSTQTDQHPGIKASPYDKGGRR